MKYFIEQQNKPAGPFTLEELQDKAITLNTLVWKEGLSDWVEVQYVDSSSQFRGLTG